MRTSLFLTLLVLPLPLWATVWHVSQGQSIQAAINGAVAGDDVIVHPGTYYESLTLKAGVDVYSTNGSSETTINGGGATQTVYFTGNGGGMAFGGGNAGFRIEGGSQYGVNLYGCSNALFGDLNIVSNPVGAALRCFYCTQPLGLTQLRAHGQSGQCLWAVDIHESQLVFVNSFIYDISRYYGIYASDSNLLFQSVEIHDCNTGLKSAHTYVTYDGGEIYNCSGTGISAYTMLYGAVGTLLDIQGVRFRNCGAFALGAVGGGTQWPYLGINIVDCDFFDSEDGMSLERCWGDVKACRFENINDTGFVWRTGSQAALS